MLVTDEIQALFNQANNIIFMTGAGVSTASGIPDYRSKGGLYDHNDGDSPEYLLSTEALAREPEKQYHFMKNNLYHLEAQPNIIHHKMALLTQQQRAKIITQNVDGLHEEAGSQNVINFHGSWRRIYSVKTHQPDTIEHYLNSMYQTDTGDILRPAITLYGEIPFHVDEAIQWVSEADLVVVVGTSLVVYPFAGLLQYVKPGTKIISINLERVTASRKIQQIIGDAETFFSELKI